MKFEHELRALLRRYINTGDRKLDQGAEDAAVAIFRIFYVPMQVWVRDGIDEDFAQDVTKVVIDLTFALGRNPFWTAHSGHLNPILANAAVTWTVSAQYLDRALNPPSGANSEQVSHYRVQALATQSAFVELMCAILSLACPDYFDRAVEIRDAVVEFKDRYLLT